MRTDVSSAALLAIFNDHRALQSGLISRRLYLSQLLHVPARVKRENVARRPAVLESDEPRAANIKSPGLNGVQLFAGHATARAVCW